MRRSLICNIVLVAAGFALTTPVLAQDYPAKPVRIIVPVSPGGITDIAARATGDFIARKSGQAVVIENRTGAGGNIGSEMVAKSAPDGYTLGVIATTQIVINPFVFKTMSYDPLNELVPVAPIGEAPQFLVINGKIPATTLKEFIAYARKQDGKLNYVSLGPGSTVSLGGVQFTRLAKVAMQPIQYRGAAPGINDLVAGNVHLISVGIAPVKSLIEAGMLRVLAAGTRKRVSYLPNVPTAAEAGLPGYEVTTWFALFAPKGTPRPVVEWLNAAVREMNADPTAARRLTDVNIDPMSMTVDEFGAQVRADAAKWERVIRDAGLTPQ
jgi:tripartite-type tricarboxylate transporter receptor subunit TctC